MLFLKPNYSRATIITEVAEFSLCDSWKSWETTMCDGPAVKVIVWKVTPGENATLIVYFRLLYNGLASFRPT